MTTEKLDHNALCPNCSSSDLVEGTVLGQMNLGGGMVFRPKGRGFTDWLFHKDVGVSEPVFACAQCGMMWSFINVKPLRRLMAPAMAT